MPVNLKSIIDRITQIHKSKDTIGIDIGATSIKFAQIRKSGETFEILLCKSVENPPTLVMATELTPELREEIIKNIKQTISKEGIKTRSAATSIMGNSVIVRYVKFPKMSPEELSKSLRFEAEEFVPFDITDVYLCAEIIRDVEEEGQPKMESVFVAAKRDIVDTKIDILRDAGLTPVVIDVDSFCVLNLVEQIQPTFVDENAVLLHIGARMTSLAISEHGIVRVVRDIPFGGNLISNFIMNTFACDYSQAEALKKQYGLVPSDEMESAPDPEVAEQVTNASIQAIDEHLIPEVQRSIDFFNTISTSGEEIRRIILTGGGALLKNFDRYLNRQFDIEVSPFNPFEHFDHNLPPEVIETGPVYAVALGLALRKSGDTSAVRAE